ncbi:MAG: hypothetical protein K2R98_19685 [Gemmataceae bacterium]|nr:hypothetical protein [Gemmataceae bacterium]
MRIETHLKGTACGHCRSWIDKATALSNVKDAAGSSRATLTTASKWRQAALRDLSECLGKLDEGCG